MPRRQPNDQLAIVEDKDIRHHDEAVSRFPRQLVERPFELRNIPNRDFLKFHGDGWRGSLECLPVLAAMRWRIEQRTTRIMLGDISLRTCSHLGRLWEVKRIRHGHRQSVEI